MKKILLALLFIPTLAGAAQQEITAVPDDPVIPSIGALKDAINLRLADIDENFDEIYPIIEAGPVYVNASAPADTKVVWIDTDQDNAIKVHIGGVWTVVGTAGSGDDLGSAAYSDVVALWTTCTGYLKSDGTCDTPSGSATYPSVAGVANWNGSAWGTSYTVGTGASNLVQLNASAQLPAVSADLLTITDTGTYFTTDTVGAVLQELGGAPELLFGTEFTETAGTGTVTLTLDFPVTSEIYGAGWAADTEGAQRDDIYAILHVGDTDDDGMVDKLDLASAGFVKVNASGVVSSAKEKEYIGWSVVNSDTATAVADGKMGAAVPAGMNGMNLVDFTCSVADLNSAASGATTVVLRRVRGGTAADMTSTGVTIEYGDYTASDEVIDTSNDDLATGDKLYVDINEVTTAAQKGLHCTATFEAP